MVRQTRKKGKNLEDIQEMNRYLVIQLLRTKGICSRAELAKESGLKQATITNIVNDFIRWGLVKETGIIDGKKGRRSIGIALNSEGYKVIGVRLARKSFTVGLFDIGGTEYSIEKIPIKTTDGTLAAFNKMKQAIEKMISGCDQGTVLGIGLALPGPFIRNEGRIALMTEFPGWENLLIHEELEKAFQLPVFIEHNANVGALAEWWLGSYRRDAGTMVYIAAGQGMGAGVIIDGKIFRGATGTAAEIGHMSIAFDGPKCECGNKGCLELYCSTLALIREVQKMIDLYPRSILRKNSSLDEIFQAINLGDELANKAFYKIAKYLGVGLVNVINAYNPNSIIIGDEMARGGVKLLQIVKNTIQEHVLMSIYEKTDIQLSTFTNDSVLLGVSAYAADEILRKPSMLLKENA